jgi:hypothetical protein
LPPTLNRLGARHRLDGAAEPLSLGLKSSPVGLT